MTKKTKLPLLFIFLFFLSQASFSHPHVFFDVHASIEIEGGTCSGVEVSLYLDDMNTLLNQRVFRPKKDGEVEQKNIVFLKYLYSHMKIYWNGKRIPKDDILFELAKLEEEQLKIDFFVTVDKKIEANSQLKIAFYDTDYYYTYDYNPKSFKISGMDKGKVKTKLYTEKGISFYFKSVHPVIYEVKF